MPKKFEYTPIPYGAKDTILDAARAYVQAAVGLDVAYMAAVECGDREAMVNIAALWMRLGELLAGSVEEDAEEYSEDDGAGFRVRTIEEKVIISDGEETDPSEG